LARLKRGRRRHLGWIQTKQRITQLTQDEALPPGQRKGGRGWRATRAGREQQAPGIPCSPLPQSICATHTWPRCGTSTRISKKICLDLHASDKSCACIDPPHSPSLLLPPLLSPVLRSDELWSRRVSSILHPRRSMVRGRMKTIAMTTRVRTAGAGAGGPNA